jgi:general secretion pathway protein J
VIRRNAGFTLVEVLISTVVLSLIMLTTLSAMRTLAKVDEKVLATTERVDEMRSVSSKLRSLLHQTHSGAGAGQGGGSWAGLRRMQSSYFDGDRVSMSWMAPLSGAGGLSGMHYLRLRRQGELLYLDIADYASSETEPDWDRRKASALLLRELESLEIAYRSESTGAWQFTFDSDEGGLLPQAIRVRIKTRDRFWPDLVVAPAAYRPPN